MPDAALIVKAWVLTKSCHGKNLMLGDLRRNAKVLLANRPLQPEQRLTYFGF